MCPINAERSSGGANGSAGAPIQLLYASGSQKQVYQTGGNRFDLIGYRSNWFGLVPN